MSTTPFGTWTDIGPISSGVYMPRPPPSIIAGPPTPNEVDAVAMITSQQATITVFPAKVRPLTMPIIGTRPLSWERVV